MDEKTQKAKKERKLITTERLSHAVHSSDLSHKPVLCDADYLQGLGIATRQSRLGSALIDLDLKYTTRDVIKALNAVMEVVREQAKKNNWAMNPKKCRRLATEAINIYLRPLCPACNGRGMLGVDVDRPEEYRPRACHVCDGSGLKDLPQRSQRELRLVLHVMQCARDSVGGRFSRVMRR